MTIERGDDQKSLSKKFFKALAYRVSINKEKITFLTENDSFKDDLDILRKKHKIPSLESSSDMRFFPVCIGEKNIDMEESIWLGSFDYGKGKKVDEDIKKLLTTYGLPSDFYNHVFSMLLYKELPKGSPIMNIESMLDIIYESRNISEIGLSTEEKEVFKTYIRHRLNLKEKGRPPANISKLYKELIRRFGLIKNKIRRSKFSGSSLEVIKNKKTPRRIEDGRGGFVEVSKTYPSLIVEKYPDDGDILPSAEEDKRRTISMRKRISRALKRNKFKK